MFLVKLFLFLMSRRAEDAKVATTTGTSDATRQSYRARLEAQTQNGGVRVSEDGTEQAVTREEMMRLFSDKLRVR